MVIKSFIIRTVTYFRKSWLNEKKNLVVLKYERESVWGANALQEDFNMLVYSNLFSLTTQN